MKKYLIQSVLVFIIVIMSGCMQFSLIGGGNKDEMSKIEDTYYGSYYNFWWGYSPEEKLLKSLQNSKSRPLYQVMYNSNYLYSLISVCSLGLAVPVDVHCTLVQEPPKEYKGKIRRKKHNIGEK